MKFVAATTEDDFCIIERLAKEIWTEHYTPIIGSAQVRYMLGKFQSREAISRQIRVEGYDYLMIMNEEKSADFIGYIGLQMLPETLFLSKIYFRAEERGKGFGRKSMQFIEDMARGRKQKTITLTVNKHNLHSINAYQKMGFKTIECLIQDIGNGFVMDDYKMEKLINGTPGL